MLCKWSRFSTYLIALLTVAGYLSAQSAKEQSSASVEGIQLASGWGPMRPTAKPRPKAAVPFGETYDSVFVHEMDAPAAERIFELPITPTGDARDRGQRTMTYLQYLADGSGTSFAGEAWLLAPHPLLADFLGDVDFVVTELGGDFPGLCAVRKGKIYEVPRQFNILLHDCGWDFSARDIPDWARILTVLDVAEGRMRQSTQYGFRPIIPAMSFQSVAVESVGVEVVSVVVRYTVDGKPAEERFQTWVPGWLLGRPRTNLKHYPAVPGIDPLPGLDLNNSGDTTRDCRWDCLCRGPGQGT